MSNKMATYTKFAVKSAGIVFVASIIAAFLGYAVRWVLTKNLALDEFGLFYSVFAFLGMIGAFKSLGFDRALAKFIPEFIHQERYDFVKSLIAFVAFIQLVTNLVVIIAVYLISDFLAVNYFHSSQAGIVLRLMAIAFFIDSFMLTLKFAFQGFKEMVYFSGIDLIRMSLIAIAIIIGFKMQLGILSPVMAYILVPAILVLAFGSIMLKSVFPQFFKSRFVLDKSLLKRISKYSIFIMVTSTGALILGYTDTIMITYFSGLKQVALYNIALPTAMVLMSIPNAIGEVLLPLTSELWVKGKIALLRAGMESVYKYSMVIILPLMLAMFSFTDLIIRAFFGENYMPASAAMKILVVGAIFLTFHRINVRFFSGIGKPQIHSRITYIAAIFNLTANLILIPIWGIAGAALTTAASYCMMMFIGLIKMRKFIQITLPIKVWAKTLISGIAFVLAIYILKRVIALNVWAETAVVLAVSGIFYAALLFLLKVLDVAELRDLYHRIAK